jgi:hypothetical protein
MVMVAAANLFAFTFSVQVAAPRQSLDHQLKKDPWAGTGMSVRLVPALNAAIQLPGQLIPRDCW